MGVRLYDTTKGVIATDEENRSLQKPGHILILYGERKGEIKGYYTRKILEPHNMAEEVPEGAKTNLNFQRIMDKCPRITRVTTIAKEEYEKTLMDYKNPGCLYSAARLFGIGKSLDEMLRTCFK